MANTDVLQQEVTPGSELTLKGNVYRLTFPMRAVLTYKQKTGDNLFVLGNWKKLSEPENMTAALYAALGQNHPDLTYDAVTLLVDFGNIAAVESALVACLQSYMPTPKPVEGESDPNAPTPESK